MSASINCPNGHGNPLAQKFCGQCGVSLVGVCANGHPNAEDQRFCGQCGVPLGQSESVRTTRPAPAAAPSPSSAAGTGVGATPPRADPQPNDRIASTTGLSDGFGASAIRATLIGSLSGLKSLWRNASKWGKAAIVAAPAAVLIMMMSVGLGHNSSWKWGYNKARQADTQISGGMSPELACRGIAQFAIRFADSRALADPSGAPADLDDAVEGCMAGLKDMGR